MHELGRKRDEENMWSKDETQMDLTTRYTVYNRAVLD